MAFVSKIGDVILTENNESFIVVDCVEYNNGSYLKLGNVLQEDLNNPSYVSGFVKEVIEKDNTYKLELVDNPDLIEILEGIIEEVRKNI